MTLGVPHTGWGSRARYESRLCRKCGSEDLTLTSDRMYLKCKKCKHLMPRGSSVKERRVHP